MEIVENKYVPEHLIVMEDNKKFVICNTKTGTITERPKIDWSLKTLSEPKLKAPRYEHLF